MKLYSPLIYLLFILEWWFSLLNQCRRFIHLYEFDKALAEHAETQSIQPVGESKKVSLISSSKDKRFGLVSVLSCQPKASVCGMNVCIWIRKWL